MKEGIPLLSEVAPPWAVEKKTWFPIHLALKI